MPNACTTNDIHLSTTHSLTLFLTHQQTPKWWHVHEVVRACFPLWHKRFWVRTCKSSTARLQRDKQGFLSLLTAIKTMAKIDFCIFILGNMPPCLSLKQNTFPHKEYSRGYPCTCSVFEKVKPIMLCHATWRERVDLWRETLMISVGTFLWSCQDLVGATGDIIQPSDWSYYLQPANWS